MHSPPHPPHQAQACADEAERLLAAGQCAAAAEQLKRAIDQGHLASRAHYACMLFEGREFVDECKPADRDYTSFKDQGELDMHCCDEKNGCDVFGSKRRKIN